MFASSTSFFFIPFSIPRQNKPGPVQTLNVEVTRARDGTDAMHPDVNRELVRRGQVEYLKRVMKKADGKDMHEARVELRRAESNLSNNLGEDDDDPSCVDALYAELANLDNFIDSYEEYKDLGRAYLLACISSHDRQRHAARGGTDEVRFYLTKRMEKYLDQARVYH